MMGIAEMFAEYAGAEADEYALWFAIEQTAERTLEAKRERERMAYRVAMTNQARREKLQKKKREWISAYAKQKRASDPSWVEKRRKANRERMARYREQQRDQRKAA